MKLPTFSGRYADFPNFIAMFNKLVGDDDNLTLTEKYNHLRNCLSGPALRTIDSLGKSSDNYTAALVLLKQRYDNKCLIFQEHIKEIMQLQKVTKGTATNLRQLIDKVSSHLNSMKNIGTDSDIMQSLIIQIVSSKLDIESQTKYEESAEYKKLPTWSEMYDVLSKRCQVLELREGKPAYSHSTSSQSTSNQTRKSHQNQSSYITTSNASDTCVLCKQNHRVDKCPNFIKLTVIERFNQAKQLHLCINCLKIGHSVKQCKSSKCKVCTKNHHTLLHRYEVLKNKSNEIDSAELVHQRSSLFKCSNDIIISFKIRLIFSCFL
jgi:NAD-specific glutamate dehydrogenase